MISRNLIVISTLFLLQTACLHTQEKMPGDCENLDVSYVVIYKADGSKQCENGSGVSPETMQQELINAGVDAFCANKSTDGKAYIAMCGAATGRINTFVINRTNLSDAEALGYKIISE